MRYSTTLVQKELKQLVFDFRLLDSKRQYFLVVYDMWFVVIYMIACPIASIIILSSLIANMIE